MWCAVLCSVVVWCGVLCCVILRCLILSCVCAHVCVASGYFALVTLFTTVIYSVTIAKLFAYLNSNHAEKLSITVKPAHFLFVWVLTFLIALLPYTTGSYGRNRSDLYCWIKTDTHNERTNTAGYLWEIFVLYLWVVCAIGYNAYVYSTVVRRIHLWKVSCQAVRETAGVGLLMY